MPSFSVNPCRSTQAFCARPLSCSQRACQAELENMLGELGVSHGLTQCLTCVTCPRYGIGVFKDSALQVKSSLENPLLWSCLLTLFSFPKAAYFASLLLLIAAFSLSLPLVVVLHASAFLSPILSGRAAVLRTAAGSGGASERSFRQKRRLFCVQAKPPKLEASALNSPWAQASCVCWDS